MPVQVLYKTTMRKPELLFLPKIFEYNGKIVDSSVEKQDITNDFSYLWLATFKLEFSTEQDKNNFVNYGYTVYPVE